MAPAVCSWPKQLEQPDERCGQVLAPIGWTHTSKRSITRLVPPIHECYHPFVHSPCVCNEMVAATNRVIGKVPTPTLEGLRSLHNAARILKRRLKSVTPYSAERVLEEFKGRRRSRYEQAWESLKAVPLTRNDYRIKAFVKSEKFNPGDKNNPDPRMIQARNARYNILLAQYLKPMEKQLYTIKGGSTNTRLIAKGLNQVERADLLIRKWNTFSKPVCYSLDASRWDKHCDVALLKIEHSIYQYMCADVGLKHLLAAQLRNKCFTSNGVRYKTLGKRMSGDMNTALGNCLLMIICLIAACHDLGLRKYDLLDDGDDCLVIVEQEDEDRLRGIVNKFLEFGHELKLENRATDVQKVVFCQSHIVFRKDLPPTFVRNWVKVLSTACCGSRYWDQPHMVKGMMGAVGACELSLNEGVPILQAFACRLRDLAQGEIFSKFEAEEGILYRAAKELHLETGDAMQAVQRLKPKAIDFDTRWSFYEAFGVLPARQLEVEEALMAWAPVLDLPAMPVGKELDSKWDYRLDPDLLGRETY